MIKIKCKKKGSRKDSKAKSIKIQKKKDTWPSPCSCIHSTRTQQTLIECFLCALRYPKCWPCSSKAKCLLSGNLYFSFIVTWKPAYCLCSGSYLLYALGRLPELTDFWLWYMFSLMWLRNLLIWKVIHMQKSSEKVETKRISDCSSSCSEATFYWFLKDNFELMKFTASD